MQYNIQLIQDADLGLDSNSYWATCVKTAHYPMQTLHIQAKIMLASKKANNVIDNTPQQPIYVLNMIPIPILNFHCGFGVTILNC